MKIRSAKAKGRRAALEVCKLLYKFWPQGKEGDVQANTGSLPGEDVYLSPSAREYYPFAIEVKNCERLDIWGALNQAEAHVKKAPRINQPISPLVFFKRNHTRMFVALDAEIFLKLIRPSSSETESALVLPSDLQSESSFTTTSQ